MVPWDPATAQICPLPILGDHPSVLLANVCGAKGLSANASGASGCHHPVLVAHVCRPSVVPEVARRCYCAAGADSGPIGAGQIQEELQAETPSRSVQVEADSELADE